MEVPLTKAGKLRSLAWATYPDVAAAKRAVQKQQLVFASLLLIIFIFRTRLLSPFVRYFLSKRDGDTCACMRGP